jgi:sterol desaturase/sphingolipid hydroxylase (fatty acid hydroxylase superfamily)
MGILGAFFGLAFVAVVFGLLERFFPATRAPRERGSRWVDLCHFLVARITELVGQVAVLLTIAFYALALGWGHMPFEKWFAMRTAVFTHLPHPIQVVVALVVIDFYGYWIHRIQHARPFWRFHAVHHSSTRLDWLGSVRNHPVADLFGKVAIVPPLLGLGIDARVITVLVPILGLWAVFIHANVPWGFGPLRYVIATPLFHRWHHASDREAQDKNFAGFFPVWDLVFGTFHCPRRQPLAFGAVNADGSTVPPGFFAQLAYPFRESRYDHLAWRSPSASSPISTSGPPRITTASCGS